MTETKRFPGHGGARPGAGRKSTYTPRVAQQMREYLERAKFPSLRDFCARHGYDARQLRRWELMHSDMANAIGTLRYRQEIALGRDA